MTIEQHDWKTISYGDVNKSKPTKDNGVTVQYFLAPSDVPSAWRESIELISEHIKQLTVEFKYLASAEPVMTKKFIDHHIEILLGKKSHRLYGITVVYDPTANLVTNFQKTDGVKELDYMREKIRLLVGEVFEGLSKNEALPEGNAEAIRVLINTNNQAVIAG